MKNKMNKKGIVISTLVSLILIILGFAILLLFFYLLYSDFGWKGRVDKETCHQSVIYRGSLTSFANIKEIVPLKCKTQKVCITSGLLGGKCKEFEGSKDVLKVRVKNKEQIEQYISKEIVDCWETMGEGKLSLFSNWLAESYGFGKVYPSCVICDRIAFDKENLKKAGIDLNEVNVMNYMLTHAVPNKNISYYRYLVGEGGKISVDPRPQSFEVYNIVGDERNEISVSDEKIPVSTSNDFMYSADKELAILFMQISAPKRSEVIKNTVKTLGYGYGGAFVFSPVSVLKSTWAALKAWPVTLAVLVIGGIYQQNSISKNMGISVGYCGDVAAEDEAREGCSVVRTTGYNAEEISQYCAVIESIS